MLSNATWDKSALCRTFVSCSCLNGLTRLLEMHGKGCGKVCGELVFQSRGLKVEPGKETISNWQKKRDRDRDTERDGYREVCHYELGERQRTFYV